MATYESFMVEAEGFQGKMTPGHNAKKGAVAVQNLLGDNKPKPKTKPGALAIRPTTRAVQSPGALVAPKNRNTKTTKEPVGASRAQARASQNNTSSASTSSSSGKPFRRVVRDGEAASKTNSPARGSEVKKSDKDLAQKQRDRVLYDKARKERDLNNRLDKEDRRGEGVRKFVKSVGKSVGNSVANQARNTSQDKGEKMQDAQVTSAKRGVYNP